MEVTVRPSFTALYRVTRRTREPVEPRYCGFQEPALLAMLFEVPAFQARGVVYVGAKQYYATCVPGGVDAVVAALPPPLGEFLAQIFVGSAMYDALAIVPISAVAAELCGIPQRELVQRNAEWLAQRDIRGVYKVIFNVLSPESIAIRLPKVAIRYFDFGEADAEMHGTGVCRAQQRGIPEPMEMWLVAAITGFVPAALSIAGAKDTRVRLLKSTVDGARSGYETRTLAFEFMWR